MRVVDKAEEDVLYQHNTDWFISEEMQWHHRHSCKFPLHDDEEDEAYASKSEHGYNHWASPTEVCPPTRNRNQKKHDSC